MFGRRKQQPDNTYTYPETPSEASTHIDNDFDEPERYEGTVSRRDETTMRPANPNGTPPEVTPMTERTVDRPLDRPVERPQIVETTETQTLVARGGLMVGAIITGVLVAFGAMVILTALVAGIFATAGLEASDAGGNQAIPLGIAAIFVITQFAAYFWGGYTAGRMARGAGAMNGFLVPVIALLIAFGTGAIVRAMGAEFDLPLITRQLNVNSDTAVTFGFGLAIAALIAMLFGGILGGITGHRWHDKLEVGEVRGRRTTVAA